MYTKRPTSPAQIMILRQLARGQKLRFSEINTENYSSDQLSYHLRELLKNALIEKDDDGLYFLTHIGSGLTLDLDKNMKKYVQRGLLGALAIITKVIDGEELLLVQKRSRHPNLGKLVLPGGQILFGEKFDSAIQRVVNIETGLECSFKLLGMRHLIIDEPNEPMQDLYFFIFKVDRLEGEVEPDGPNGTNIWVPIDKLSTYDTTSYLSEIVQMRHNNQDTITEYISD